MKKQIYALKEHSHEDGWMPWRLVVTGIIIGLLILVIVNHNKFDKLETHHTQDVEIDSWFCEGEYNLGDIVYDSCSLGCIKSTRYYFNNSGIDFGDSIKECFLFCIEKSIDIKSKICSEARG